MPRGNKPKMPKPSSEPFGAIRMADPLRFQFSNVLLLLMGATSFFGFLICTFGSVQLFRLRMFHVVLGTGSTLGLPWMAVACGVLVIAIEIYGIYLVFKTRLTTEKKSDSILDTIGQKSNKDEERSDPENEEESQLDPEDEAERVQMVRNLWKFNLISFLLLLILSGFTVAISIWYHIQENRLDTRLKTKFANDFMRDSYVTEALHLMHYNFACCGVDRPGDFLQSSSSLNWLKTEAAFIPFSCCNLMFEGNCTRHPETIKAFKGIGSVSWTKYGLNPDGCGKVLSEFIRFRLLWLLSPVCVATGLQIFISVLFRYYQTASAVAIKILEDSEVVGYLWGSVALTESQPQTRLHQQQQQHQQQIQQRNKEQIQSQQDNQTPLKQPSNDSDEDFPPKYDDNPPPYPGQLSTPSVDLDEYQDDGEFDSNPLNQNPEEDYDENDYGDDWE